MWCTWSKDSNVCISAERWTWFWHLEIRREHVQQVTVWRCCCRETSTNRCSGTAVMEDGRTNHLCCSNLLSAKFNFTCFFFLMEPSCCVLVRGWCHVLDAPEALMGLSKFWCPICSWTGEPLGWMSPTVSVFGLHIPSITCLCCHQSLQEKLLSWWGGNAWTGASYIPTAHSARPLWKFIWWEQHVLVLIKIHFIQLWPFRASCWDITDLHPLLEMGCLWGWTLCLQKKGSVWDGHSLMQRGSATPWEDDLIFLPPEKQ